MLFALVYRVLSVHFKVVEMLITIVRIPCKSNLLQVSSHIYFIKPKTQKLFLI